MPAALPGSGRSVSRRGLSGGPPVAPPEDSTMSIQVDTFEKELVAGAKVPDIRIGDRVRVHVRIQEGNKTRVQVFEGIVIAMKHGGIRRTITVRKISNGVGVERIFPVHAPVIERIEVTARHRVRRAKLYYLRDRQGKAARLKEIRDAVLPGREKAQRTRKRRGSP